MDNKTERISQNHKGDEDDLSDGARPIARSGSESAQKKARHGSSASLSSFRERTNTAGGSDASGSSRNSTLIEDNVAPPPVRGCLFFFG